MARIDAGFAANRAVHLSEQGGRNLHEIYAAQNDARRKAGEVADNAAAKGDQRR